MNVRELNAELFSIYTAYLKNPESKLMKEDALRIHSKYCTASTILSNEVATFVARLIDVGADTGVPAPSVDEVKKFLKYLRQNE